MTTHIQKLTMPLIGILALLTGCATVASAPPSAQVEAVTVSEVIERPELFLNEDIVWGGTVLKVENRSDETWIEIIQRPLGRNDYPDLSKRSNGRFLAVVPGFLDPLDYANGRSITINGIVNGKETRKISEADYTYPVIAVADHRLWQKSQTRYANNRKRDSYGYYRYPYVSNLSFSFGHRFGSRFGLSFHNRYNYGNYSYGKYTNRRFSRGRGVSIFSRGNRSAIRGQRRR